MLRRWRLRRRLRAAVEIAVLRLQAQTGQHRDRDLRDAMHCASAAAGNELLALAERELGDRDGDLQEWAEAMADFENTAPAIRLLTWAVAACFVSDGWPRRWAKGIDVAADALGITNEFERQVADFGPTGWNTGDLQEYVAFNRLVCGLLVSSALGTEAARTAPDDDSLSPDDSAKLGWIGLLDSMMERFGRYGRELGLWDRLGVRPAYAVDPGNPAP